MFAGLSAFPLTPLQGDAVAEGDLIHLIQRLAACGVDSITVLGSTGSYAYLTPAERRRVTELAVEHAAGTPVFVGVGALRTSQVLGNARSAAQAGADGLLLAPMTYQPLTDDDVFGLYRDLTEDTDLPVIVYDNPATTHFDFSIDLYRRIAELPGIASIKVPGATAAARSSVAQIRSVIPEHVTIGVSGDAFGAAGLNAGCDVWYSALAGTLPEPPLRIARAAQQGRAGEAASQSQLLLPLWSLFAEAGGSIRVIAAIAEHLGLAPSGCLPLPIQGLTGQQRARVIQVLESLGLASTTGGADR